MNYVYIQHYIYIYIYICIYIYIYILYSGPRPSLIVVVFGITNYSKCLEIKS